MAVRDETSAPVSEAARAKSPGANPALGAPGAIIDWVRRAL